MTYACGICGGKVAHDWSWSKDEIGRNPITGVYTLCCSLCGCEICLACAKWIVKNAADPIYHHIGQFHRLEARVCSRLWGNPAILLCNACNHRIGLADGSFVHRISDYYERAGRFEDLAHFYEVVGLPDKAGEARARLRHHTVKQVNVDLNALLEKVAAGGLAIPYRCRSCGATLTIDSKSKADGLTFCSYCASAVDTESLAALLKLALG